MTSADDSAPAAYTGPSESTGPLAPSGAQIVLRSGAQEATIVEVGGALRSYTVAGHPLFDGYDIDERCTGARGHTLIPWPNRLRDGTYTFRDEAQQLALTEPAKHNAIHGLVRWANWSVEDRSEDRVTMAHVLYPQPGWPFTLGLSIAYHLGSGGLAVTTTATNLGSSPSPYGSGAHPYLRLGTPTIDRLHLRAPGATWMPTNDQGIPTGTEPVDGTRYDFRHQRLIADAVLNTAFGDLLRDHDGLARVDLHDPVQNIGVDLWMDRAYSYVMLFTGDSLPQTGRRRTGLGVEPMTCAPNALQSGQGLTVLEPAGSHVGRWGINSSEPK